MRCSDTRMVMWVWGSFLFCLCICRWRRHRWPQMPGGAHDDNEDTPDEEGRAGGVVRPHAEGVGTRHGMTSRWRASLQLLLPSLVVHR